MVEQRLPLLDFSNKTPHLIYNCCIPVPSRILPQIDAKLLGFQFIESVIFKYFLPALQKK